MIYEKGESFKKISHGEGWMGMVLEVRKPAQRLW